MKKKLIVLAILVATVLLAGIYLWAPGTVPPGQQPLVTLSSANIGQFQDAFDGNGNSARLILLLSPT